VARGMDMNKMLQQVAQMQEQMVKAQEELANEIVEASVGGGMVVVKATGGGEITEVKIKPAAIGRLSDVSRLRARDVDPINPKARQCV
jgi:nucleoid-associated protein EbfC